MVTTDLEICALKILLKEVLESCDAEWELGTDLYSRILVAIGK